MSRERQLPPIPETSGSSRRKRISTKKMRQISAVAVVVVCVLAATRLPTLLNYFSSPPPNRRQEVVIPPEQAQKDPQQRVDLSQKPVSREIEISARTREGQSLRRANAPEALRTSALYRERAFPNLAPRLNRSEN